MRPSAVALIISAVAVIGLAAVVTPVHVNSGSLRCGDPPYIGLLHVADNLEVHAECHAAELTRRWEVGIAAFGGVLGIMTVGLSKRGLRVLRGLVLATGFACEVVILFYLAGNALG